LLQVVQSVFDVQDWQLEGQITTQSFPVKAYPERQELQTLNDEQVKQPTGQPKQLLAELK
jgi:hypothetical protein